MLISLLVARLVTPVMAAYFLKPHRSAARPDGMLMRWYQRFLGATLDRPAITLAVGLLVFVASLWSTTLLPTGFIPPQDDSRAVVSLELPPGATLADTAAKTDAVARELRRIPEVTTVYVVGGNTPIGDAQEVRRASMIVNLVPKSARSRSQKQVEGEISRRLAAIPDVRGWYVNDRGERELAITVLGRDPVALDQAVARLESAMRRLPGFSNVAGSAGVARPELRVVPRTDEAARLGITTEMIGEALRVGTLGDIGANLAKFRDGDRLIPIRVQLDTAARRDLGALGAIPVTSAAGVSVPLLAVADLRFAEGPSSIERHDRERRVVIGADLVGNAALGAALAQVYALPESRDLPAGVAVQNGGDAEIMAEVFAGFSRAIGAGMMMVLAVLVLLLGDIFQPVTILLSLPLSLGGVILALLLTHQPISLPVAIGILMLLGIVTKNAIMLVDFAVEERRRGVPRRAAILAAGAKRARPIVMTTVAMVAGMVPSALGLGDGGEFREPMAIGVIGGLLVSTVLSLVFVPSFYVLMDRASRGFGRLFRRGPARQSVAVPDQVRQPAE